MRLKVFKRENRVRDRDENLRLQAKVKVLWLPLEKFNTSAVSVVRFWGYLA